MTSSRRRTPSSKRSSANQPARRRRPALDPVALEVFRNLLASIAEEMGTLLQRTAFSPNIKERRDFSCALFDSGGEMIAQAAHIPVHLGSSPLSVRAAIESVPMGPGDAVILNDPYRGGTHLPDITLVSPVHLTGRRRPDFYVANRAHHADVGGAWPGSMALSTEILQEGVRIPPLRLVEGGRIRQDLLDLLLANMREPGQREGDLRAQAAANAVGARRLAELCAAYGRSRVLDAGAALMDYAERKMRAAIRQIPEGSYSFADRLDDDGQARRDIRIQVRIRVHGGTAEVDFSGTDPQVEGCVNANLAITLSAVFYVFRLVAPGDIPENSGLMRPVRVIAPEGTVVNARPPAAVAGGNVETSQRIVDVCLGALARALPHRIPAASAGTMNNLAFGGSDPRRDGALFTYYETIAGGMGAGPFGAGCSAVQTHMTNTWNTPTETLEASCPVIVEAYAVRRGSGGAGRHRGGDGVVRQIRALVPLEVSMLSERRRRGPYGLEGGKPGKPGRNLLVREGKRRLLPAKFNLRLQPGDSLRVETPGGGGWGRAPRRRGRTSPGPKPSRSSGRSRMSNRRPKEGR